MKAKTGYRFTNWAKNQQCTPARYYQPTTEQEISEILACHSKIRMVGSGHSWSDICLADEAMLNLDNYNRIIYLDKEKLQITAQPGIKLWQLNEELDKHGLALSNLGSIAKQSLAGAICTGTHGTGIGHQILGAQVEQFTLVKPDGEKQLLHKEKDKALFNLCLVNLGSLGVVSEMTLNVVPAFQLQDHTFLMKYDDAVNHVEEMLHEHDHLKMWWFPHTDKMVIYTYNRTTETRNDSHLRQWFFDELLSVHMYRLLLGAGSLNRNWRKPINRMLVKNFEKPLHRIEKSYKVFNVPEPPLHRETEWAFDIKHTKEMLLEYKKLINHGPHRLNFIQEIRFTKADDFALSPCYQRNSVWLGAYNADNFGWSELLHDFEQLAIRYKGRPHWGKEFTVGANYLAAEYLQYGSFAQLRQTLDPTGKLMNAYIQKLLGSPAL